jgi:hypothetical protein
VAVAGSDDDIDVELVTMPGAAVPPPAPRISIPFLTNLNLSRRDWILLGAGGSAVILAVIVGMVVALSLR